MADANSHSPSPKELKQAIEAARAYYDGSDAATAKRIDNFTKPFRAQQSAPSVPRQEGRSVDTLKTLWMRYVIYSCCAANEVALAESFYSRCTDCYIGTGGGFSYYAAGISVRSAYIYDTQHWESSIQWAQNHMCVDRTHRLRMARCRENLKYLRQSKEQGEQDVEELAGLAAARSDDEVLQLDTLDGDEVAEAKPGAFPVEYGEVLRSLSHLRWMQVLAQVEAKNTEVRRRRSPSEV
ncbi:hypothetical protein KC330_g3869 [Hortaea werneckii]|nr:hypothetical protein KC330_g3869 [Hortaea werneckii]